MTAINNLLMKSTFRIGIIICCLVATFSHAQHTLSGSVVTQADSLPLAGVQLFLNGTRQTTTDSSGNFKFSALPTGRYTIQTLADHFKPLRQQVVLSTHDLRITLRLASRDETLEEVMIFEKKTDFGFSRLRGVENMGIYEGKKSEVINPDQLVANLSTNNARQIYARVAGLNIWENEGGGLQLSIGGRGLDPNRTSNFNVRQNGYDISADALGYPESYYTPPVEAVGRIQIVRGAASLQYGTQFGGLINFVMRKPVQDRKLELVARQTAGSFGFYNAFTSASGTTGKLSYYTFFQYKRADGWRANSQFNSYTFYSDIDYKLSEKSTIGLDVTHMNYLAKQPGGLSDVMFAQDPRQTNRARNWFDVTWNMLAIHFDHQFNSSSDFNLRVFGLNAHRYSLGFRPNRVATIDDNSERDLIKGHFTNWGAEARYLKRYNLAKRQSVLLIGGRYYHGFNHSLQGQGSNGKNADFRFVEPDRFVTYDYKFPNRNVALFGEHIFYLGDKLSVTPGIRFEYISTRADGYYGSVQRDLAGNVINITRTDEFRENNRQFILAGVGVSYKPARQAEVYANISQNYRSITFSDMRIANPSSLIDPEMKDEKGYSIDLGTRSHQTQFYNYDISLFYLNYDNRIGEIQVFDAANRVLRLRTNVGQAVIFGLESYGEADFYRLFAPDQKDFSAVLFGNFAYIKSEYRKSINTGVKGNEVEFVPRVNFKTGLKLGYKKIKGALQLTHLTEQFSEATNARDGSVSSVVGLIPAYTILDLSLSYELKRFRLEGSVNNLANEMYFTRRATGYPGPGILPSDGRGFYFTLQVKI
jgi:Fe(3+) dicitrate transport protein